MIYTLRFRFPGSNRFVTVHRVQWPWSRKRSNISSDYGKATVILLASGALKAVVKSALIPDPRYL